MPNSSAQRQRQILDLLQAQPMLTIHELVDRLGVSAMTVHRDLRKLAAAGAPVKTRSGIVGMLSAPGANSVSQGTCAMCARSVPERTAFIIRASQHGYLNVCCPHCGLMLLGQQASVELALAADFLYGRMVSAYNASYVVDSSVTQCCEPGVLAFATAQDAERFRTGFGGEVMSLAQAQAYLRCQMATCAGP